MTHESLYLFYLTTIIIFDFLFASDAHSLFLLFYVYCIYKCAISALNNVHYFYQFRWRLYKKASQVLYLHFALKRREFLEEFHEKQEQVSVRYIELYMVLYCITCTPSRIRPI
jgi:hypothetical protein